MNLQQPNMDAKERTIANYIMKEKIGEGTFGKVYLGIDKASGDEVALKCICTEKKSTRDLNNLRSEAEILRKIRHENVIQLRQFIESPGKIVIAMDYAGNDLAKLLKKEQKLSVPRIKLYGKQILLAMLYLDSHRILHRDLKPQNILIKGECIKICDFGFAKKMSASTTFLESIKGSPLYIAPEIMNAKPYNQKVDVWSFGIILYELFAGVPPFNATTIPDLRPKILYNSVKFPSTMPADLRDLIDGMLQKCPTKRYDWEQVKAHEFFKSEQKNIPPVVKEIVVVANAQVLQKPKVLARINPEFQCLEIAKVESQLISGKLNARDTKTNILFYHRILGLIGQACIQKHKIPAETIQKIFKIVTYLITKADLPADKKDEDITKHPQLMTAIITLAGKEESHAMLFSQLHLLGFMLKNNFDEVKLDLDNMEEIIELVKNLLVKKELPHQCFVISLTLLGIMANQAIATLEQSQQFFMQILQDRVLAIVCDLFRPELSHSIILECLEKFIHPNIESSATVPVKIKQLLNSLRRQVADTLAFKQLIPEVCPLEIYCTSEAKGNEINYYAEVLYECLCVSKQFRRQFLQKKYWASFLEGKHLVKLYCLAYNNLMITEEGTNILSKQTISSFLTVASSDNKLVNVYLINLAKFNLLNKRKLFNPSNPAHQKQIYDTMKGIVVKVNELLMIDPTVKSKSVKEVLGGTQDHSKYFDRLLIGILYDLALDPQFYKGETAEVGRGIIQYALLQLKLSEQSLLKLLILKELHPTLRQNKKINHRIEQYVSELIISDQWDYLATTQGVDTVRMLIEQLLSNIHSIQRVNGMSKEDLKLLLQLIEEQNFHRVMFAEQFRSDKILQFGFMLINNPNLKCKPSTIDYLTIQVLPAIKHLFRSDNLDLVLELVSFVSYLARLKQEYSKYLMNLGIVELCHKYMQEGAEMLREKTLHLVGNLAKFSTQFFELFAKYQILQSVHRCLVAHPNNLRILKNAIYAVGNISFYNQKFAEDIKPMLKYFLVGLEPGEDLYFVNNTVSAVSNLLRHSSLMVKDLVEAGITRKVLELIHNSSDDLLNYALNALKKALNYQEFLRAHSKEELRAIYEAKKNQVKPENECIRKLKEILG